MALLIVSDILFSSAAEDGLTARHFAAPRDHLLVWFLYLPGTGHSSGCCQLLAVEAQFASRAVHVVFVAVFLQLLRLCLIIFHSIFAGSLSPRHGAL